MVALLGVLLGILLFCWANEWLGFWPAVVGLGCYAIEPNILAHSSLGNHGLWHHLFPVWPARTSSGARPVGLSIGNLIGLVAFCALAAVSKFSAVVLGPIIVIALAVRAFQSTPWTCRMGVVAGAADTFWSSGRRARRLSCSSR